MQEKVSVDTRVQRQLVFVSLYLPYKAELPSRALAMLVVVSIALGSALHCGGCDRRQRARVLTVEFRCVDGGSLKVVYQGRVVARTNAPFSLEALGPEATSLAMRENSDGSTDFLVNTNWPLGFTRNDRPVRLKFVGEEGRGDDQKAYDIVYVSVLPDG